MVLRENFEVHDTLNPKIWNSNNKLRDEVKLKILEIIDQFISTCDLPLNIVDACIVGSNASYNYTKYSDLDVHLVCNFELVDAPKELLQTAYNAVKAKFNQDYDISIHGVDVELYVEDIRSTAVSNGVFSLYKDEWVKFPKRLESVPQVDITTEVAFWKDRFEDAINSENSTTITNVVNDIYLVRKASIDADGEYGKGNLVFKEIRNMGLLDAARSAYKRCRSKELTLEKLTLHEDSRTQIIAKSKRSDKGFERFKRRVKSRVANTVKQYNAIDMNKLFKEDILTVDVEVKGETDTYTVKISFGGFLECLHDELKRSEFGLKPITRALTNAFNRGDVFIHCSCPDSTYRFNYWTTKNGINSGDAETRPANVTNPDDSLGSSCKHVLLVIGNLSWLLKVASTIKNYVSYMEKHYQRLYASVIYPAIYEKPYEEPVQLDIMDDGSDELDSETATIDKSNEYAVDKNKFKQGNKSGIRFTKEPDRNQLSLDDISETESNLDDNEDQV